jgi:hypothetical protein
LIQSFYILKLNGVQIFSHDFVEQTIDEQILAGFFASVANFSQEALQSLIDRIDIGDNKTLILYKAPKEKTIYAAIIPDKDDVILCQQVLSDFSDLFNAEFGSSYSPKNFTPTKVMEVFNRVVKPKIVSRNVFRSLGAFVISTATIGLIAYLILLFTEYFYIYMGLEAGETISMEINSNFIVYLLVIASICVFFLYTGPTFLFGFLTGQKLFNRIAIIVILVLIELWFFYLRDTLFWVFGVYIPLALVLSVYCSDLGIKFANSRKIDSRYFY